MIYTEKYQAYDMELGHVGDEIIYRQLAIKLIENIPIDELKKLFNMHAWSNAEPRGKPGPVLYQFVAHIET